MEKTPNRQPKYTLSWLGLQSLLVIALTLICSCIAAGINRIASGRTHSGLLDTEQYVMLSDSIVYCFAVLAITLMSVAMIEAAFRKPINFLQYTLVAAALTLFYLLLLSITEFLPFGLSYIIVSAMTIVLIALFIKGLTQNKKAVSVLSTILIVEYGLIFILINLGSMALLVGSLSLFILIAAAMYFTLKLKVVNEEITIK